LRADAEMQARIDYLADRATVELLSMNHWERVVLRENLQSLGEPFAG